MANDTTTGAGRRTLGMLVVMIGVLSAVRGRVR
jgi:hypothetical protein